MPRLGMAETMIEAAKGLLIVGVTDDPARKWEGYVCGDKIRPEGVLSKTPEKSRFLTKRYFLCTYVC